MCIAFLFDKNISRSSQFLHIFYGKIPTHLKN